MLDELPNGVSIQEKWGDALGGGFVVVPSVLLRYQYRLKIDCAEMAVLLNLMMAWWKSEDLPFPRPSTIANRMGVSVRTVQRHIQGLEEKQLIKRVWVAGGKFDDRALAKYDLSGIVEKLKEYGVDARLVEKPLSVGALA